MIGPGAGAKVMVATRPVDFRNYAATMIMRGWGRWWANFRPYGVDQLRITMTYPEAASIAISLSGGRNLPGFMPSGAKASSISSFSVGSARR